MSAANLETGHFSFIGVSTSKSAIMRVFPAWAKHLGLEDVDIRGYDLAIHAPRDDYRRVVDALRCGPGDWSPRTR
jgi:shikimate 5-dehydrogenase